MNTTSWKNTTPQQKNLWDYINASFHPTVIVPLYFQGIAATSEFATYVATKLYLALDFKIAGTADTAAISFVSVYDESNALVSVFGNSVAYWNTTNARYVHNFFVLNNFCFGKLIFSGYTNIMFNGYRLTI